MNEIEITEEDLARADAERERQKSLAAEAEREALARRYAEKRKAEEERAKEDAERRTRTEQHQRDEARVRELADDAAAHFVSFARAWREAFATSAGLQAGSLFVAAILRSMPRNDAFEMLRTIHSLTRFI